MLALPAFGPGGAAAAPLNVYVNNAADAHCSDTGSGLQAQPFCTVQKAADVVLPGQTVSIAPGDYPEQVKLTRSGTANAPITFTRTPYVWGQWPSDVTVGSRELATGLSVVRAEHVRIKDLHFAGSQYGLLVENSTDVEAMSGQVTGAAAASVRVTGADSRDVTVGRFWLSFMWGSGIVVDGGAKHTTLTTNLINGPGATGISVVDAPATVVVSNSVFDSCWTGLELGGAATDAVVVNNVVATGQLSDYQCRAELRPQVKVAQTALSGLRSDYNVLSTVNDRPAYEWGTKSYNSRWDFTAETGQGAHDSFDSAVIREDIGKHDRPLPTVDSADETAPGMLDVDAFGNSAVDDPIQANSGTGKGFRDRGATEYRDVGTAYTPTGPTRILDTRDEGPNGR
ncbi:right-handed parallel beta-helix repeat-containing protein [Kitasatospora gansuensis]